MLIFCMVSTFALIFMTFGIFICWIDDKKSHLKHVYVHKMWKFLTFKFSKVMQQHT